jgi:4-amino-4-deoxy-L-arabinose transferase-like glycosyltransferase
MPHSLSSRRFTSLLIAITLAALALRLGIRLGIGTQAYWSDGYGAYAGLAESLCTGRGYAFPGQPPTAFRVPLYTMLVAATTCGVGSPWPLITVQALGSAATAALAGLIARRMAGSLAGLLAAAIYAAWPYAAWHDLSLQESGLHTFMAMLATWLLLRARERGEIALPAAAGSAVGLMLLTRATMLPFALCALIITALPNRASPRISAALIAAAAMVAVLSPWLAYSRTINGTAGLGTEGGSMLFSANHPLTFSAFPARSMDESRANVAEALTAAELAELKPLQGDEAATDNWFFRRGLQSIAADPVAFVSRALRKLWIAFGPMPAPRHEGLGDLAYAAVWTPFVMLALGGIWLRRRRWRDDLLLHAHIATFCAMTAMFWAQTAHRSYLDPYLAIFAGVALLRMVPKRLVQSPRWPIE